MVLPLSCTFEYVGVIPDHASTTFSCDIQSRPGTYDPLSGIPSSLVGPTPRLHVEDAGPTPNPGPRIPASQRSRLRLVAANRQNASLEETSFILDRGVISALRPGDVLHMALTGCGNIGVSAIRDDQLIFAVGAITAVPLGCDVKARIPYDLVRETEAIFQARDGDFRFAEYPVEIHACDSVRIMYEGRIELGSLQVWVLHGHYFCTPGVDACASVVRKGACPVVDANSSALFLDSGRLGSLDW